ncbi:unnamed protein product [Rotaria socialis]|uniref:Dynein regulatory complex protein 1 n=1 Tax=Rotaria socialis TaxID=392032 RepID=A0A820X3C7_9BILA|nr:unnamed protein product [Rotaria socialis]CAF3323617.1 unnamed protein product [Rotaria socialis]CAF4168437.1 unnamed protein product [Rotaria socialis]CAF4526985.1 unnamed protein product [Rotaria socialis]
MELLAIHQKSKDGDDNQGPSLTSQIRDERILARRIRVDQRIAQKKRKTLGIVSPVEDEHRDEASLAKDQIEQSRQRLVKLEEDGLEFVTNIRVGQDLLEHQHRLEEEEATRKRNERLEQDTKSSKEKFDEIIRNWEGARTKELPRELHELLMAQKHACGTMLEEKNKLIGELEKDLKNKDDYYVKMLRKFDENIKLLVERMNEQVKSRRMYYARELHSIEEAFIKERQELLDKYNREWGDKLDERRSKEEQFVVARFERHDTFERDLQRLRIKQAEEFNATKVKLENQVQEQQRKIEEMKAIYQLSQEKYEYNYKVLKKRDEENLLTIGVQKNRKIKLNDLLTHLNRKLTQKEKQYKTESIQAAEEYKRTLGNIQEIKRKAKHFLTADMEKFHELWIMNEERCKEMAQKLLDADRIIFEQQLGLNWVPPELDFMNNIGPIDATRMPKPSIDVVREILTDQYTDDTVKQTTSHLSNTSMKNILELICDEGDFLIEPKLLALLEPLDSNEKNLIKLDGIFRALKIENEEDIKIMAQYFIDYIQQKNGERTKVYVSSGAGPETEDGAETDNEHITDAGDSHVELIHPNHALKALREFLEEYRGQRKATSQVAYQVATLDDRDDSLDKEYWSKYPNVVDDKREHLWDALLSGLQKYHSILTARAKLMDENNSLAKQNDELRLLLSKYMQSKVNQELQIPPSQIIQLQLAEQSAGNNSGVF